MSEPSSELQVRLGVLNILYQHTLVRNLAIVFLIVLILMTYWSHVDSIVLIAWAAIGGVISLLRIFSNRVYQSESQKPEAKLHFWTFIYGLGLFASGLHWTVLLLWILPAEEPSILMVTILITSGITSAGYMSSCLLKRSSFLFLVALMVGLGIRLLTIYPSVAGILVLTICFYIFFINMVGAMIRSSIVNRLKLYHEKDNLAKALDKALEKAEIASREKTKFLGITSHEIRTSVNGIVGIMQVMEDSMQTAAELDHLATMRKSSSDLLNHLNNLLDLNKIEEGKLTLEMRTFDWVEEVNAAVDLFKVSAWQKRLELKTVIDCDSSRLLKGDSVRLGQILKNLIGNAVKFTVRGSITVSASTVPVSDSRVSLRLEVLDTGKGIGELMLKRLFQTYVQEDETVHRIYGGSGLGLSICQEIAELMGTKIQVVSEKGKGTRFWLEPEFDLAETDETNASSISAIASVELTPQKCLIVQDDLVSQKVAKLLLEKLGMIVEIVDSGEKAVKRVAAAEYDYVFMDIKMLGISGIEATLQIRALELNHKQPKIIALTGSVMESERAAYAEAGMDGCLAKPLLLEDLVKVF